MEEEPVLENDHVHYVAPRAAEELSNEQRIFLTNLNAKLSKVEAEIKAEVVKLMAFANAKVADTADYIDDYEIDCCITFILDQNDPTYSDEDDNILVTLHHGSKSSKYVWSEDGINHNEFAGWNHVMSHEQHCWLYHCLYDHTDLGWSNMLRIGFIWLDIKVDFQKIITL